LAQVISSKSDVLEEPPESLHPNLVYFEGRDRMLVKA
jgi:hypothetical protein